jgi:hypothetical protein
MARGFGKNRVARSRTVGGSLLVLSDLDQALEQFSTGMDSMT